MALGSGYYDDRNRHGWGDERKIAKEYSKSARRLQSRTIVRKEMARMGDCEKVEKGL